MQVNSVSSATGQTAASPNQADLKKAAQQFEAIFLRQMIGAMRSSSMGEGVFDSSATDQFRDMADARTAESMANKGSLGIAELLLRQLGDRSVAPKTDALSKASANSAATSMIAAATPGDGA